MVTKEKNRIITLDVLRGFAILGIFLVNMLSFHSPVLYLEPFSWWTNATDQSTYIAIDVLAQGSFYPLFSILFGYSLVLLQERTIEKGMIFTPIALKRLGILLVIGIFHAAFIWHGDILINYAILGLFLIPFLKWSQKGLYISGTLLWFIPNLLLTLLLALTFLFVPGDEIQIYDEQAARQSAEVYQQGSFVEIFQQRLEDWYLVNQPLNSIFMLFSIFPLFLIGAGAAKGKLLEKVATRKKRFLFSFIFFLIVGLLFKLAPYVVGQNFLFDYVQDTFGGPLLAIAYVLGISLLVEGAKGRKLLIPLAPVGKMSISNYLLQSIISTMLFYSYGFGLYNRVSVLLGTILVFVIFILQISISRYWLKSHPYGPVEWLWRSLIYGKKQPWTYSYD